jgi:hypothetical protein
MRIGEHKADKIMVVTASTTVAAQLVMVAVGGY